MARRRRGTNGTDYEQQVTCEELMASDYYDCCMCGANGDHNLLSEEATDHIWGIDPEW